MFVKRQRVGIALLTMLAMVLLVSTCFAAEGETVQVQGVVSVTRDANDIITAVQLVTNAGAYNVELDANGEELGESMEGENVEVEGVVSEKDGQKWLTVSTFSTLEE